MSTQAANGRLAKTLLLVGRIALAGIFLFAAYAKLKPQADVAWSAGSIRTSLAMFGMQVDSYQLLSPSLVNFVAHTLPPFELFLGIWLLSGVLLPLSGLVTSGLLGGFFVVLIRSYRMGLEINCGCFGPGERLGPGRLIGEGVLLAVAIAVTVGAFRIHRKRPTARISARGDVAVRPAN
ncbi:MAG: MauE/DoxX family redox-associated membrane protein [Candidatus Acidiferrales bacterium]